MESHPNVVQNATLGWASAFVVVVSQFVFVLSALVLWKAVFRGLLNLRKSACHALWLFRYPSVSLLLCPLDIDNGQWANPCISDMTAGEFQDAYRNC